MQGEQLWAPWRATYLRDLKYKAAASGKEVTSIDNFLATYWLSPEKDQEHLVIHRNDFGMILLNRFPYTCGHLLVAIGEPRPTLLDYDADQRRAFWDLIELATALVHATLNPQGINLGINEGAAAGAGLPEHLHGHLVPRWNGDTNFITVVGDVRIMPDSLEQIAKDYRQHLPSLLLDT